MTIVVTGGGSGGHITPILAVARELKRLRPDVRIVYISHTGDGLDDVVAEDPNIDEIQHVRAGKFRRYHGEGLRQLLDHETMILNIRDAFWILVGMYQSLKLLRKLRPAIIFTRGSYVSVPVALSGAVLGVPYVTHDSDAIPSLTNRLIARWAAVHAVALDEELYPYPIDRTVTVGVPVDGNYRPVGDLLRERYREELRLEGYDWVILVTGGGLGAQRLNEAVVENAPYLLNRYRGLAIVHLAGRANEQATMDAYDQALGADSEARRRVFVKGFVTGMHRYSGAANVVVARGGATNLAELAMQAKPCIIVPNPLLTGGHQLKNTKALADRGAIVQLTEDQIQQERRLSSVVSTLLDDPAQARQLSQRIAAFARPDSARQLAVILLQKARQQPADGADAAAGRNKPGTTQGPGA
ncbi:MAG TPA: UDP-N-acetylglucosamine--N-acetylmuramyl-(pentapeptide) pyrophosphoryl-undecaprenol N-acetylglucosamine transferase [Candidatus Saccharimonadales bacterium]|nr:UDP-N-acetylglucosamine--N-acetylmuramyl-(pentapeptide) pyrophosphoryl-undecaprenol N-acetylglucosamine transferase [Candidatus Saccharimonadales bacterium]